MLIREAYHTVQYYVALFESSSEAGRETGVAAMTETARKTQAVYQLRTVLRSLARAKGVAFEALLDSPARNMVGSPDILKTFLQNTGASSKVAREYPYILNKFLKDTGLLAADRCAQSKNLKSLSKEWQTLRAKIAPKLSVPHRGGFTLVGAWASEKGYRPDDLIDKDFGDEFHAWLASQTSRFYRPANLYCQARSALKQLNQVQPDLAMHLPSRDQRYRGLPLNEWPDRLRGDFDEIMSGWKDSTQVRGPSFGGELEILTIDNMLVFLRGYVRYLSIQLGGELNKLSFKDIWQVKWIKGYGEEMRRRITDHATIRLPNMLRSELQKPTSTILHWYQISASIMANDLKMSEESISPIRDAIRATRAKVRIVRDKDKLIVPASSLDRIADHMLATRKRQERHLLNIARTSQLPVEMLKGEITPEMSRHITIERKKFSRLFRIWRACAALASNELLLRLMRYRPLRSRNFRETRFGVNLLKDPARGWSWEFGRNQMKRLQKGIDKWKATVPKWLCSALDYYKETYWEFFRTSPGSQFTFLNHNGARLTNRGAVYSIVTSWSRRVLKQSINPHLFRDIVIHEILDRTGGNVVVAAYLIGDSVQTVLKSYTRWNAEKSVEVMDVIWETARSGLDYAKIVEHAHALKLRLEPIRNLVPEQKNNVLRAIRNQIDELRETLRSLE